jgi:hypothetical protein
VRIEPGPRVDLTALERGTPVGMLQVDQLHVGRLQAVRRQRAQQEEPRIGPARRCDFLALRSRTLRKGESLGTTSAVHSGREYKNTVLIGVPFARASSAALPAVEPNCTAPACKNWFALFDPSESTQSTPVPRLASASSSQPLDLSTRLGGL